MKRQPVPKFKNKRFGCKCLKGKCPNYKTIDCGAEGGERIKEEFSYDYVVDDLKKSFEVDHTFGNEYHAEKNRASREKKKNGK